VRTVWQRKRVKRPQPDEETADPPTDAAPSGCDDLLSRIDELLGDGTR
jgi:hypothetical protein